MQRAQNPQESLLSYILNHVSRSLARIYGHVSMYLTEAQINILKQSTVDETAYQRVLSLINELQGITTLEPPQITDALFAQYNDFFQSIIDLPIEIYIKDRESRFVMANRQTLRDMRVTSYDELIGKTDVEVSTSEFAKFYYEEEQTMMATGEPIIFQKVLVKDANGDPDWIQYTKTPLYRDGEMIGMLGINHNVTSEKLVEQELEQERYLLKTLLDHIKDIIYIKDRESRFLIANKSILDRVDINSLDELIGKTDFDHLPHDLAQKLFDEEQEIMKTGKPVLDKETYTDDRFYASEPMWHTSSKIPLRNQEGEIIGLVGINRDITNQKLAEQRTVEMVVERKKSEFLNSFITSASHEFFTPISIIRTAVHLISRTATSEKVPRYVTQITDQTQRLEKLVDSMLFMVSLDQTDDIDRHRISVSTVLTNAVDHVNNKYSDSGSRIELDSTTSRAYASCSEMLLHKALIELFENAIHFTTDDDTIRARCQATENGVQIIISDTGTGMTEETVNAVFQRFYRGDKVHTTSGFGLGLPIVYRIIELHQGEITVTSEVGQGTTITIHLPEESGD